MSEGHIRQIFHKIYITFDIDIDITGDIMFDPSHPFKHWIRHTASVPKGFLRYYVLRLLKEKPMSGSEIIEEISKETGGRWKPSPGSVYPLLAWLQDNGYIKELPRQEDGMKRYVLTEKGEKIFEEQVKLREKILRKLEFSAPPFLHGLWPALHREEIREIQKSVRRLIRALINLRAALEENLTEQALKDVGRFLNDIAEKIEEKSEKLKEK